MRNNFGLRKWMILVLFVLLLSSAGVSLAAPGLVASFSSGVGYDPLSPAEQQQALAKALNGEGGVASAAATRSEVLLVERHQETKDVYRQGTWPRRSDVYVYYYDTDTLDHLVVNNQTNTVDQRETLRNVQLPPTENEIQNAVRHVFENPELHAELAAWFKRLTSQELTSFDQIAAKAFIFHADSMGTADIGNAGTCGVQRCVQLLIYTKDMIAFDSSPVVNLSTQQLVAKLQPN